MNLAIIGLMSITFMTSHLFQFRFAGTEQFFLFPPPTLIDWWPSWLTTLTCFWIDDESFPLMVRIAGPNMDPSTSQPKLRLVVCAAPSSAETTEQAQGQFTTVFMRCFFQVVRCSLSRPWHSEQTSCRKVRCGVPPPASFCSVSVETEMFFHSRIRIHRDCFCWWKWPMTLQLGLCKVLPPICLNAGPKLMENFLQLLRTVEPSCSSDASRASTENRRHLLTL